LEIALDSLSGLTSEEDLRKASDYAWDRIKSLRQDRSRRNMATLGKGDAVEWNEGKKGKLYKAEVVKVKRTRVSVRVTEAPAELSPRFPVGCHVDVPGSMLRSATA
jgi:hypothetical protein